MESIRVLIEEDLLKEGIKVDNVEFIKEGSVQMLRITIDKDGTVDLDDCVNATHIINKILDEKDPIEEKYILEVCSKQKGGTQDGQ